MYTTRRLVEMIRKKNGNCSNYRIHQILGCSKTTVSNYVNGGGTMSDSIAVNAAEELGLSSSYVIACVNLERHQDDKTRSAWETICRELDPSRHAA